MRFNCADALVLLRICAVAHLRGNTLEEFQVIFWRSFHSGGVWRSFQVIRLLEEFQVIFDFFQELQPRLEFVVNPFNVNVSVMTVQFANRLLQTCLLQK